MLGEAKLPRGLTIMLGAVVSRIAITLGAAFAAVGGITPCLAAVTASSSPYICSAGVAVSTGRLFAISFNAPPTSAKVKPAVSLTFVKALPPVNSKV